MKLAIISDIHGNLRALEAVVADARANGVDKYIFAGDYCLSSPDPDKCLSLIRSLDGWAVRGNEEGYLENLIGKDQSAWTDGQMQISYWNFRNISPENRAYMLGLPKSLALRVEGVNIYVTHNSQDVIGEGEHAEWRTSRMALRYGDEFITPERLARDIQQSLDANDEFQREIGKLTRGVYIFGHSHTQWDYSDGKRLLINPGSCGLSLDCVERGVPYTILHINTAPRAERRRVEFDMEAHIQHIKNSSQYAEARVWSELIISELRARREKMYFFLSFMKEYAAEIGDAARPYSVSTWEGGFERWRAINS